MAIPVGAAGRRPSVRVVGVPEGLREQKNRFGQEKGSDGGHTDLDDSEGDPDIGTEGEDAPALALEFVHWPACFHVVGEFCLGRTLLALGEGHGPLGLDGSEGEGESLDIAGHPEKEVAERVALDQPDR